MQSLVALDHVHSGVIADHRSAMQELGDLDPVHRSTFDKSRRAGYSSPERVNCPTRVTMVSVSQYDPYDA